MGRLEETPLIVSYSGEMDPYSTGWLVTYGWQEPITGSYPTKEEAIETAKDEASIDTLPGVVVLKKSGGFDRFIPNRNYWKHWASGRV